MNPLSEFAAALPHLVRRPSGRDHVLVWQEQRLRCLLVESYRNVARIRTLFDEAGVSPNDIRSVADLSLVPVTTKHEMQQAGIAGNLAKDVRVERLVDRSTSGSTGERMVVKRTSTEERILNWFRWRALWSYGLRPLDRLALLLFHTALIPRKDQRLRRIAWRLGLFEMRVFEGLTNPDDTARALARFEPHAITGMTSVIAQVADRAPAWRREWRPKFVAVTGELLTEPLRRRIEAFGAPIYDVYGCNELNVVAWACARERGYYHVCDDAHVIEILREDGSRAAVGEWGEIVATSLFSYAMPFIRYRVGDVAMRGPDRCPCGLPFSTFLAVRGRTIDTFTLEGGRKLHPWELMNAVKPSMEWIKQFQLVQVGAAHVRLLVVPLREPAAEEMLAIRSAGQCVLGSRVTFEVTLVSSIATSPGKTRLFVPFGL